jgi:hypothetical protein
MQGSEGRFSTWFEIRVIENANKTGGHRVSGDRPSQKSPFA